MASWKITKSELPGVAAEGTAERLAARRAVPAWLASLLFHTLLIVVLVVTWRGQVKGTQGERGGPVGIAVSHQSWDGESFELMDSTSDLVDAAATDINRAMQPSDSMASAVEAAKQELLNGLKSSGAASSGDLASASGSAGLGAGGAPLSLGGSKPKAKTNVFGIEGEGYRFVYVFDRSDSMNGFGGKPLKRAKSELTNSIESLGPAHQFQVIFYNDSPLPFGGLGSGGPSILRGEEKNKADAKQFINSVIAVGGTQHVEAIKLAMAMGPDVIFFLTDAESPAPPRREIDRLVDRADQVGCTFHTIQFGSGGAKAGGWIEELAKRTRGEFRFINIADF